MKTSLELSGAANPLTGVSAGGLGLCREPWYPHGRHLGTPPWGPQWHRAGGRQELWGARVSPWWDLCPGAARLGSDRACHCLWCLTLAQKPHSGAAALSEGDSISCGLCGWVLLSTMPPPPCSTTCPAELMGRHRRNHCN